MVACSLLVTTAGYGGPRYTDLRIVKPIHGDAQAGAQKAAICLSCHGADGVSVAPTFPRLAGQREDYLYHRLFSFKHADPKDPYYSVSPMTAMATALSDADMRDLAAYFASQTPRVPDEPGASDTQSAVDARSATGAASPSGPTASGERLFLQGDSARGIPPCQGCHGADGNGPSGVTDQYGTYPSLRGQYAPYVVARLTHYHGGQPADTSNTFIMQGVTQGLDDDSMQAIAGWLNSLPPARSP
jgi:cytochrome c553